MKRVNQYKKLFNVEKEIDLKQLKSTYRNLVKEWHPDKFRETDEKHAEAEVKSKEIIDGDLIITADSLQHQACRTAVYLYMFW